MNFIKLELPESPLPDQNLRTFSPIYRAIWNIAKTLDNFIGRTYAPSVLRRTVSQQDLLVAGDLVYVDSAGSAFKDSTKGFNAVYVGYGEVQFGSGWAKIPANNLVPGSTYWLALATGQITNTPTPGTAVQLLGVAVTTSDLQFNYNPPTV